MNVRLFNYVVVGCNCYHCCDCCNWLSLFTGNQSQHSQPKTTDPNNPNNHNNDNNYNIDHHLQTNPCLTDTYQAKIGDEYAAQERYDKTGSHIQVVSYKSH